MVVYKAWGSDRNLLSRPSSPLSHPALATLAVLPFIQHTKVVSASGPLHLLFILPGLHFSLLFVWKLPPLPVRSLFRCHFREVDLWSPLV